MRKTSRGWRTILAAFATISLLAIVGTNGAGAAAPSAAAEKPVKGGSVIFIGPEPPSMNPGPWGTLSATGQAGFPVYDVLAYEDKDTAEVIPHLVKSIEPSPDATVITFKLRPSVKFTDGTVFDSAALKANFDFHANPANRSQGINFAKSVASWDVTDPLVAKATLVAPDAAFAHNLVTRLSQVVSPTALAKYGAEYGTSIDKVVGAGPFILKEWTRGSQMVFTRNPDYWDAPKPYLDQVTIKFVPDITAAYNTVLTGGADAWATPNQEIEAQARAAGLRVEPYRHNVASFRSIYFFNLARPPFNDLLARQAVVTALDPKKVAAARNRPVTDSIYNKDSDYYDPAIKLPKYDAKKAQDLINQWSAKNGGKPLEFTITDIAANVSLGGSAEAIQAAMSGYQNLKVNVQIVPQATFAALGSSGNFDLYPSAKGGSDPSIPLNDALNCGGGRNFGKYCNAEMDAALKAGLATSVLKERKKQYSIVQKLEVQDLPEWILPFDAYSAGTYVVSNKSLTWDGGSWTGPLSSDIYLKNKK